MRGLVFTFLISLFVWSCGFSTVGSDDSYMCDHCHLSYKTMEHTPSTLELTVDFSKSLDSVDVAFSNCSECTESFIRYQLPSIILHDGESVPTYDQYGNDFSLAIDQYGNVVKFIGYPTAKIPLDEDLHLRFDLLDSDKVAKSYDIDMEPYLKAYVKDSASFKVSAYDNGLKLQYYSPVSDTSIYSYRRETCFEYSYTGAAIYDSSYKCCQGSTDSKTWNKFTNEKAGEYGVLLSGEEFCIQTPSRDACITDSVSLYVQDYHPTEAGYVDCFENTLAIDSAENDLWVVDSVIRPSAVRDSLENLLDSSLKYVHYKKDYLWQAFYGLGKQSSFETDSVVIRIKYSE